MNRTRAHVLPPALRTGLLALATAGTLLLASCGGGGSGDQAVKFKPTRMVVFGDETSLLLPPSTPTAIDGRKYGINGFTLGVTPPVPDCQENPIWVQLLAREFDLVFGQCNPTNAPVTALMRATNGAKVADVVVALDTFLAADKLGSKDLVNIFVGTHDVLELHDKVRAGTLTEAAAVAEAVRRGGVLATQFDRITNKSNSGSRALYVLIPDLGQTPLAVSAVDGRAERVRLLTLLTERFNTQLRGQITNNGRSIGLVDAMQEFRNAISGRSSVGFANVTTAACITVQLVDCTTSTLVPVANLGALEQQQTWLWADSYHLSPGAHAVLSDRAIYITRNNPF